MKRRHFAARLAAMAGATGFSMRSQAATPAEGTDYIALKRPMASAPAGKIDVIEFFWYGCPHCYAFEPIIDPWSKRLAADVTFRRVPVAFREHPFKAHQHIYYALDAIGQLEAMHRKVFAAIHAGQLKLDSPQEIANFATSNGLDVRKFMEAMNSFSVTTSVRQANALSDAYAVDGVPAIGVQGRFFCSSSMTGTHERTIEVADHLIQRVRKEA